MGNLLTYVQQYGHNTFDQKPVSDIDILLMTELGYLTFDGILPASYSYDKGMTIEQVWQQVHLQQETLIQQNPFMITQERMILFQTVAESDRYRSVKVFGYVNDIDVQLTKQFAAMLFQWQEDVRLVVYRGTDESLIGWKEDFMMTYVHEVPAQVEAVKYFQAQAEGFDGTFIISGHSKGGNLALYAAAMQDRALQERINRIYCWDAPGVHRTVIESDGYQRIVSKAIRYIPQDSIVGVMLESTVPFVVIQSTARGANQHSALTWSIEDNHFVEMESLTQNSLMTDQTFKKWTASVPDEDLELFWDCFFELLFEMGIDTVNDMEGNYMFYLQQFINRANHMEPTKRDVLIRVALSLVQQRYTVWRESLNVSVDVPSITIPTVEEVLKNLHLITPNLTVVYEDTEDNESIRRYYQKRHAQKKAENRDL